MHERLELPSHELIALREQNAMLKNALLNERDASRASGIELEEQLKAVTEQRDRLAKALTRIAQNDVQDLPGTVYAYELGRMEGIAKIALQSLREDQ